nr:hypothetical protein [Tanacetum cinerariifolium]
MVSLSSPIHSSFLYWRKKLARSITTEVKTFKKGGGRGRGVKEKQHGLASNTAKDISVTFSTIDEHVNTPSINSEKPLEPNMGDQINDTRNVEVLATSNSTPITSASIPKAVLFAAKLKGDMTRKFDRLDAMMDNGPWFIHNNPYILKKWNPDVNLQKEDVDNVPVWVKLHGVPMIAFSEDALSIISTKLGNVDGDSEVKVVFDETTDLMDSTSFKGGSDRGNGTNSLLEQ